MKKGFSLVIYLKKILLFYSDGFKRMRVGKKLWLIIGIKLFLFFVLLKLFFFPNILNTKFSNDQQKADFVMENLIEKQR